MSAAVGVAHDEPRAVGLAAELRKILTVAARVDQISDRNRHVRKPTVLNR